MTISHHTSSVPARWLLRISAVLWAVWGLVHVFAGVVTLQNIFAGDTAKAIQGITSKVPIEELVRAYHPAESALLSQHALNLAWFGLVTTVAAPKNAAPDDALADRGGREILEALKSAFRGQMQQVDVRASREKV